MEVSDRVKRDILEMLKVYEEGVNGDIIKPMPDNVRASFLYLFDSEDARMGAITVAVVTVQQLTTCPATMLDSDIQDVWVKNLCVINELAMVLGLHS